VQPLQPATTKSSSAAPGLDIAGAFSKVATDIERAGAQKRMAEDVQRLKDEQQVKKLDNDIREAGAKLRRLVGGWLGWLWVAGLVGGWVVAVAMEMGGWGGGGVVIVAEAAVMPVGGLRNSLYSLHHSTAGTQVPNDRSGVTAVATRATRHPHPTNSLFRVIGGACMMQVDEDDYDAATAVQKEIEGLTEERELLRLPPAERGLKRAATRSRSNSGSKALDFFADLGQKTVRSRGAHQPRCAGACGRGGSEPLPVLVAVSRLRRGGCCAHANALIPMR
jgi:hypothetical protein